MGLAEEQPGAEVIEMFPFREGVTYNRPPELEVIPYTQAETDAYLAWAKLPPRLPNEEWHKWAARTEKERGVGSTVLKSVTTDEGAE